jgi:hypothetical protein
MRKDEPEHKTKEGYLLLLTDGNGMEIMKKENEKKIASMNTARPT